MVLNAAKDTMAQGLNMTGLPMAPLKKQVLKAVGYAGDVLVIGSPLSGPLLQ